jgi:hypothetical protein
METTNENVNPLALEPSASINELEAGSFHGEQIIPPSESSTIMYENPSLLFSVLHARDLGMTMKWKPWDNRIVKVYKEEEKKGRVTYAYPSKPNEIPPHHQFVLNDKTTLDLVSNSETDDSVLTVKCLRGDNIESQFRCIGEKHEINKLMSAINSILQRRQKHSNTRVTTLTVPKQNSTRLLGSFSGKTSATRRAITIALDEQDKRSKKQRIVAKRGAYQWLPVVGANDLTHGSW